MPEFSFDASSMDNLAADLRRAASLIRTETDRTLAKVVTEAASAAKDIAGKHSNSIPPSINVEMAPGEGRIFSTLPLAVAYELGNARSKSGTTTSRRFRRAKLAGPVTAAQYASGVRTRSGFVHPVFGNENVKVTQEGFPFLRPARLATSKAAREAMGDAWDKALRPYARGG